MAKVKVKEQKVRYKSVSCTVLNVRSEPTMNSLILKQLLEGTIVEIDPNFDNPDWDHIITDPNIEGYCMKQFLTPLVDSAVSLYLDTITIKAPKEKEEKTDVKEK